MVVGDRGPTAHQPDTDQGGPGSGRRRDDRLGRPAVGSAEDQLLLAVESGSLGNALRSLSPEMRQALQVTVIDGLTTREAAQLLGIPEGTVKSRVRLAKQQMRRQLINVEEW